MSFEDYLAVIQAGTNLSQAEAKAFLASILDDTSLSDGKIAEALTALTNKTVTVEEVCGFVEVMRARMIVLPHNTDAIDTCGTGGDKAGTFNISTAAAILVAAGGVSVAKHGNRAATSRCGSADVLEALGVPIDLPATEATRFLQGHGFVFLFARQYHPSLKRLSAVRQQLGFPTVFNLLGPLLNPAAVKRQVVGTFSLANAELLANVMVQMDYEHALILTSDDGLDEASLNAPVTVYEVKDQAITEKQLQAGDYGLEPAPISALKGGDAADNARLISTALQSAKDLTAHQRIIVLNAGLGFYVAGAAPTIEAGVKRATEVISNGKAAAKLEELSHK